MYINKTTLAMEEGEHQRELIQPTCGRSARSYIHPYMHPYIVSHKGSWRQVGESGVCTLHILEFKIFLHNQRAFFPSKVASLNGDSNWQEHSNEETRVGGTKLSATVIVPFSCNFHYTKL